MDSARSNANGIVIPYASTENAAFSRFSEPKQHVKTDARAARRKQEIQMVGERSEGCHACESGTAVSSEVGWWWWICDASYLKCCSDIFSQEISQQVIDSFLYTFTFSLQHVSVP